MSFEYKQPDVKTRIIILRCTIQTTGRVLHQDLIRGHERFACYSILNYMHLILSLIQFFTPPLVIKAACINKYGVV